MKSWKNEGILLHNMNVTDMVRGTKGPFHIEKPKVLYNANTRKYVMWMIVDNTNRSLAMAGVATSDYASGPFTFIRSFYPDGNKTRDQALHQEDDGKAANSSKEASKIYRSEPVDYLDTKVNLKAN